MASTVIDLDAARIAPLLIQAIEQFLADPPDTDYQRGYLAAILTIYLDGIGPRAVADSRAVKAAQLLETGRDLT